MSTHEEFSGGISRRRLLRLPSRCIDVPAKLDSVAAALG